MSYERLIMDVFDSDSKVDEWNRLTALLNIHEALGLFQERTKAMIEKRYIGQLTYREIGKEFQVSGVRVAQVINRALRLLRQPVARLILFQGMTIEQARSNVEIKKELSIGDREEHKERAKELSEISIDVLELSFRSYDKLYRNGIYTIGILMMQSEHDLLQLKHFGKKCLMEVKEQLNATFNSRLRFW